MLGLAAELLCIHLHLKSNAKYKYSAIRIRLKKDQLNESNVLIHFLGLTKCH